MRFILVDLLLLLLACIEVLPAPKAKPALVPDSEQAVEGIWSIAGETYDGAVVIRRMGPTYFLHYATGRHDGKGVHASASVGVGMLTGDVLAVSWVQGEGKLVGLTVYKLKGREMVGRWTPLPGGGFGTETLRFLATLPKE